MTGKTQTFVYDGVEVIKTGRNATKKLTSGKLDVVVEITPLLSTTGAWKKWVQESTLFEVEQEEE